MNLTQATVSLAILAAFAASIALADDFKTMDGKEYKGVTVTRVEPDGIVVKAKTGISKLYFVELPQEVQRKFNYNPQQASAYSAAQAGQYEVYQKQQEEVRHRQEEADAQNRANIAKQEAKSRAANDRAQELEDRAIERWQQKTVQKANEPIEPPDPSKQKKTTVLHVIR